MSAIASVLLSRGFGVSGSDASENEVTRRLVAAGAKVHKGHRAENIQGADLVVTSSAIRRDNAERVQAKLIIEGANGPTTPAADDVLQAKGIPLLPDILANAGGVTVSYFEWVQNIENEQWDLAEVNAKLQTRMQRAVDAVIDRWQRVSASSRGPTSSAGQGDWSRPDLRTVSLAIAIERVASIALKRGIWP